MILSDSKIKEYQSKGTLHIENFNQGQLNPNSYNLRLMNKLLVYTEPILDAKANNETREIIIPEEGLLLMPGILYIGSTSEYIEVHEPLLAKVDGRSSIGRLGIFVHYTAGFIDTGFCGNITLEIGCTQPVRIYPNMEICQIEYELVEGKVEKPYCGKYQGQTEPVASRMYRDLEEADDSDPYLESYYHNFPEERPKEECEKPTEAKIPVPLNDLKPSFSLRSYHRAVPTASGLFSGLPVPRAITSGLFSNKLSDDDINIMALKDPRSLTTDILGRDEKEVRKEMRKTLSDDIRKVLAKMNINIVSDSTERDALKSLLRLTIKDLYSSKINNKTLDEVTDARVQVLIETIDIRFDEIVSSVKQEELNLYLYNRYYIKIIEFVSGLDNSYARYANFKNRIIREITEPRFELDVIKDTFTILPPNFALNPIQNEGNE